MPTVTRFRLTLLAVTLALTACAESPAPGGARPGGSFGGPGSPGGAPPAVVTGKMETRPFGVVIEAVGTALAKESVEVTSKSTNTITAIRFTEGQRVAAGAVLVEFDRAQTAAALAEAEANLIESRNQFNRGRDLSVTQALSKAQLNSKRPSKQTRRVRAQRGRDSSVLTAVSS